METLMANIEFYHIRGLYSGLRIFIPTFVLVCLVTILVHEKPPVEEEELLCDILDMLVWLRKRVLKIIR